ncbi:hypothetical protein [Brachybacterium sp. YJGR34]|uniref:hypothetical protein n=1 Tax=Brachybacterium sp. YJGR34 TaxID=2059911 RepID=UPI000E0C4EDE|nr:hypothetical protein [Brachybacterium sp. YJGR34]
MNELPSWVIPLIVIALVVIIVLIIVGVVVGKKKRERQHEEDRRRAAEMRARAESEREQVKDRELKARERSLQAEQAKLDADRAQRDAEKKQQAADQEQARAEQARTQYDEDLRRADEVDPDSDVRARKGARADRHDDAAAPAQQERRGENGMGTDAALGGASVTGGAAAGSGTENRHAEGSGANGHRTGGGEPGPTTASDPAVARPAPQDDHLRDAAGETPGQGLRAGNDRAADGRNAEHGEPGRHSDTSSNPEPLTNEELKRAPGSAEEHAAANSPTRRSDVRQENFSQRESLGSESPLDAEASSLGNGPSHRAPISADEDHAPAGRDSSASRTDATVPSRESSTSGFDQHGSTTDRVDGAGRTPSTDGVPESRDRDSASLGDAADDAKNSSVLGDQSVGHGPSVPSDQGRQQPSSVGGSSELHRGDAPVRTGTAGSHRAAGPAPSQETGRPPSEDQDAEQQRRDHDERHPELDPLNRRDNEGS